MLKIAIMGAKGAGKSMLAEILSWELDLSYANTSDALMKPTYSRLFPEGTDEGFFLFKKNKGKFRKELKEEGDRIRYTEGSRALLDRCGTPIIVGPRSREEMKICCDEAQICVWVSRPGHFSKDDETLDYCLEDLFVNRAGRQLDLVQNYKTLKDYENLCQSLAPDIGRRLKCNTN